MVGHLQRYSRSLSSAPGLCWECVLPTRLLSLLPACCSSQIAHLISSPWRACLHNHPQPATQESPPSRGTAAHYLSILEKNGVWSARLSPFTDSFRPYYWVCQFVTTKYKYLLHGVVLTNVEFPKHTKDIEHKKYFNHDRTAMKQNMQTDRQSKKWQLKSRNRKTRLCNRLRCVAYQQTL